MDAPTDIKTHPSALTEIAARALQAMRRGDKRISVRKIMEAVRAELKVSVNNNDQTAITDRLIANQPQLADLIETRTRGTRGKNKAPAANLHPDLADLAAVLHHQLRITAVTVVLPDGKTKSISMTAVAKKAANKQAA